VRLKVALMEIEYDIERLLEYVGPSFRHAEPMKDGTSLLDYRNTDENERNISLLLSSQSIPFHIERPQIRNQIRMVVTIPKDLSERAEKLLAAAARSSAVDVVRGLEGLRSRW
jgi:hypothetical protein